MSTLYMRFQVTDIYRLKLRDDLQGVEGDEVLRRRVEGFVNLMRPSGILVSTFPIVLLCLSVKRETRHKDQIEVHSVNLGVSAPHLSNARSRPVAGPDSLERVSLRLAHPSHYICRLTSRIERV